MAKKKGKGKTANREIQKHNPPKQKRKRVADIFYSEKVAPLYVLLEQARSAQDWDEFNRLWKLIGDKKKEYRMLLDRNEWVNVG